MKYSRPRRASSGRTAALRELDRLEEQIKKAGKRGRRRGSPGLVEPERALERVRRLRTLIRKQPVCEVDWRRVVVAIVFLSELAREIYSILSYFQSQKAMHVHWVHHKAVAYRRRVIAGKLGQRVAGFARLFVPGGKGAKRSELGIPQNGFKGPEGSAYSTIGGHRRCWRR
jgi:hypothetical protein